MRRNQVATGAAFQRDLEQVTRVKAEYRASVRSQVADLRQGRGDPVGRLEAGRVNQMVHFSRAVTTPVDCRDLHREHETYWLITGGGHPAAQVSFQIGPEPEQPGFRRNQGVFQFGDPGRMSKVPGADNGDALAQGSGGQMRDVAVFTARAGKL